MSDFISKLVDEELRRDPSCTVNYLFEFRDEYFSEEPGPSAARWPEPFAGYDVEHQLSLLRRYPEYQLWE